MFVPDERPVPAGARRAAGASSTCRQGGGDAREDRPPTLAGRISGEDSMRIPIRLSFAVLLLLSGPRLAFAQASIAGQVKDSSGAVLPGVTVEASSPALIEKVRSTTTDGNGQYRIEDLRPGTYEVTFSLPGFASVKRQGIELTGTFTATVNAELRVGAVAETIT